MENLTEEDDKWIYTIDDEREKKFKE